MIRELGLQLIVQRITWFLKPTQPVRGECLRIGDGILQVKAAVCIHRQLVRTLQDFEYGFYAPQVLRERRSTDFHLHHGISKIKIPLHFILQGRQVFLRIVVATRGIDENFVVEESFPKMVCEESKKG